MATINITDGIIIDTLSFCHYQTIPGYILGLFQYIPIGLFIGSFFWALRQKDAFFVYLLLILKISWIVGISVKYTLLYTNVIGHDPNGNSSSLEDESVYAPCNNYAPSFFDPFINYAMVHFFNVTTTQASHNSSSVSISVLMTNIHAYPHIDILQNGIYLSYVLTFYLLWLYPIIPIYIVAIIMLCIVPWSFIASGAVSFLNAVCSLITGIIMGSVGLWIGYTWYTRIRLRSIHPPPLDNGSKYRIMESIYKIFGINKYIPSPFFDYDIKKE
jgi:hypothetical protein